MGDEPSRRIGGRWRFRVAWLVLAIVAVGCADVPPPATAAGNKAGPPFTLRHDAAGWRLVSPAGRPFFSLGVCCVDPGLPPEDYDPENPSFAAWRHYPDSAAWTDAALRRVKGWGFTTLGGWADVETLDQSAGQTLYLTPVLHMGSSCGMPWLDMWDERNVRRMDEIAREQILAVRDDPRLIGYYSDNELGWWNATLWKMTFEHPPESGQRRRLVRLIRDTYGGDWNKLLLDFEPRNAAGWADLDRRGALFLRGGGDGVRVMRRFLALLADRYYSLARDVIRRYDRRALFLGDRYQSFYYPEVARACGRYADAVSCNLNPAWSDGTFPRFQLGTLHALMGKPILASEVYAAARENRSGNRNTHGTYPVTNTQETRARAAGATLRSLLRLPYVVGADWFQYADEPTHGRGDGENFNFGLVDVNDRPYEEVTSLFPWLAAEAQSFRPSPARPDAAGGVPRAPADPFAGMTPTHGLEAWDRERGFVKPTSPEPLADLYLCWDRDAVYLGLYAFDGVENDYYQPRIVPKKDWALLTVRPDGGNPIRARVGAGREPIVSDPRVRAESPTGAEHKVYAVAVVRLPAEVFGKTRLTAGDSVRLNCELLSYGRAYRTTWEGTFVLRE